jgi:hypothetical protein
MGLPFSRTVDNLKTLYKKFQEGGFKHRVAVSRVSGTPEEDQEFLNWVKARFPEFKAMIKAAGNWMGNVGSRTHDQVLPIGCMSWFQLSIIASGLVDLCCMDGLAEVIVGDVRLNKALDIYNSPEHRKYRDQINRKDIDPCSRCTYPETKVISL